MGIFVTQGTLPGGVQVNNVYMSFTGEGVYVAQNGNSTWTISSSYTVRNSKSVESSSIRVPITASAKSIITNPYNILYQALQKQYPNSVAVIEPSQQTKTSNLVLSNSTLVSLYKDLNTDSNTYVIEEGTSNLVLTSDTFSQLSNVLNQFTFTVSEDEANLVTANIQSLNTVFSNILNLNVSTGANITQLSVSQANVVSSNLG